jgi:hypothetical protein
MPPANSPKIKKPSPAANAMSAPLEPDQLLEQAQRLLRRCRDVVAYSPAFQELRVDIDYWQQRLAATRPHLAGGPAPKVTFNELADDDGGAAQIQTRGADHRQRPDRR